MIKKIAIGLIFTMITGVLVVGAINRTSAKTAQYAPSETVAQNGNGGGQNRDGDRQYTNEHEPLYLEKEQTGQGGQGQGQGNGRYASPGSTNVTANDVAANEANTPLGGQGQGYQGGNGQNSQNNAVCVEDCDTQPLNQTVHDDLLTYQGVVTTAPAAGVEMVIDTVDGSLTIGTGPAQWLETGITLAPGDEVTVVGFWEDGEFKATTITRVSDNLTVTLRDETGRPMWSGSVRNTINGQGQGRGQGQGNGNGKVEG